MKRTEEVDAAEEHAQDHAWIYVVLVGVALSVGLFFLGRYTASRKKTRLSGVAGEIDCRITRSRI